MGVTMSAESQHLFWFSFLQIVQSLLLVNVILMSDGESVSFTSTVHHPTLPAVMVFIR